MSAADILRSFAEAREPDDALLQGDHLTYGVLRQLHRELLLRRSDPGAPDWALHEVLDRASLIADQFDRYVLQHERLETEPDLTLKATAALNALHAFYQAVGEVHLADEPAAKGP